MSRRWNLAAVAVLAAVIVTALVAQQPQPGGGTITTAAGTGTKGFSGDGGPATRAALNFITGDPSVEEDFGHLALDSSGNLYITDKWNHRIRRVDTSGNISTIAGISNPGAEQGAFSGDGGPASRAALNYPCGVALDRAGNLFIADEDNNRIRKIDTSGNISTVAGNGQDNYAGDGGRAINAALSGPCSVAVDPAGNLYIADTFNDVVRKVGTDGLIFTIAGIARHTDENPGRDDVPGTQVGLGWPSALLVDNTGNNLYISDHHNNVVRVLNLQTGLIRRIAGTGEHNDDDDMGAARGASLGDGGSPTLARLGFPMGLAQDAAGNLYVCDMHDDVVRRITSPLTAGAVITTPVGLGFNGFSGDGGPGWNARLSRPTGLAIDSSGNLFIADWYNQRVRKVTPGGGTPQPIIFDGGLVNGASFAAAPARIAPGSIIAIFGRRLSPGRAVAGAVPLPRSLLQPQPVTVQVTAGSNTIQMPLFFVSPDQINAQLPVELPANTQATVTVKIGDLASNPLAINPSTSDTGIFTYSGARALAVNQDGKVNALTEGAARGSTIVVYVTGQGELDPPVPTGQAAPLDVLSRAKLDLAATIGGQSAKVDFLGATPGFVGLSQANIVVPTGVDIGNQPLVITVGGRPSNLTLLTVK